MRSEHTNIEASSQWQFRVIMGTSRAREAPDCDLSPAKALKGFCQGAN